jgi:uncharacterized protein YjaZ
MDSIKLYIANAHGQFDQEMIDKIEDGFSAGKKVLVNYMNADKIDVVFVNAPDSVIPEQGLGGLAAGPYNIYISLDPDIKFFTQNDVISTLLHETHHCLRMRGPGYGTTLGEAMISEGLATLCEEEYFNKTPIYAEVKITDEDIKKALKEIKNKDYNHNSWFFGSQDTQRWFGYTYGYQLAKAYSKKTRKNAVELVNTKAALILP